MMSQYLVREPATSAWMLARAPLGDGYAALHAGLFAMQDANHLSVDTLMSFPRRSEPKVYFWKKMGFPTFVPKVAPAYVCAVVGCKSFPKVIPHHIVPLRMKYLCAGAVRRPQKPSRRGKKRKSSKTPVPVVEFRMHAYQLCTSAPRFTRGGCCE